jgi:hypothetical protein
MGENRLKTWIRPKNGLYIWFVLTNSDPVPNDTIAIQGWLRPALTPVLANRDYDRFAEELSEVDALIRNSAVEEMAVEFALEGLGADATERQRRGKAQFALFALRSEILRHHLGAPGFVAYSSTLASSELLSDFCGCRSIAGIKWTSKSTLQRASSFFSDEQLRQLNGLLLQTAGHRDYCAWLGLASPADLSVCLIDSTCLEANIHFPVDWVLLGDVARTLLKAVKLIRRHGLVNRMPAQPDALAREMSKLCIEMTHSGRKPGSKKARKKALRRMKRLLKNVGKHALRHRDLLDEGFARTKLSRAQAERIVARVDEQLALLPKVVKQAHERIIGERPVASKDKILSAYEADIEVVVRGKAGASVEFGNQLLVAESSGGLIVDCWLYGKGAPGEVEKLRESLERQLSLEVDDELETVVGDRGFDSRKSAALLEEGGIDSAICPKDPDTLKERLADPEFSELQRRRGSTEARVAIIKNHGCGRVWRSKGLASRRVAVGWSVLQHNLLRIAWLALEGRRQQAPPEAA